jgi:hypothetical protein
MRTTILTLLISVSFSGAVLADRPLEKTEVLQIFETLTGQPAKTWISSGTIRAGHEQYRAPQTTESGEILEKIDQQVRTYLENPNKLELTEKLQQMKLEAIPFNVRHELSNEYTMNSNVIVKFDGNRFYWEINVDSRVDSVKPAADLAGNSLTKEFDLGWNQKRVFAWDGEKYIRYFRPGNQATVTGIASGVNGPLTAGVIPWGYGRYSYKSLSNAQSSAIEVESNGQSEIHLTIVDGDRQETFVLDPGKKYATKSSSEIVENTSMTVRNYSDYQLVGSSWCPGSIIIERYDTTTRPPRLIAYDIWDFSAVSTETPEPGSFDVDYEYDALIEDFRFGGKPLQFRYSAPLEPSVKGVNLDKLLRNRLEIAHSAELEGQNCATVSLKYACGKLGLSPSWKELGQLVHGVEKRTTMFEMQRFVDSLGFDSLAVKTDLEALRTLDGGQAILHLAGEDHYVVLGNIDDKYVRLIDLDKRNFYYRQTIDRFSTLWDGTALVVDNGSLTMKGPFAKIDDARLRKITGAENCQSCTDQILSDAEFPCPDNGVPGSCGGAHTIYYERYGCEEASSGSCSENNYVGSESEPCIEDDNDPTGNDCIGNGEWTAHAISACQ